MALTSLQSEIRNEVISEMSDINQYERLIRKAIKKRNIVCPATRVSLWAVLPSAVRKAFREKMRNEVANEKSHSMSFSEKTHNGARAHERYRSYRTD